MYYFVRGNQKKGKTVYSIRNRFILPLIMRSTPPHISICLCRDFTLSGVAVAGCCSKFHVLSPLLNRLAFWGKRDEDKQKRKQEEEERKKQQQQRKEDKKLKRTKRQ